LSKISNKQYLIINLLEAPVLAFILSFFVRYIDHSVGEEYHFMLNDNIPAYIFMSIVVALFIGLTVSAEEIFKDLKILKRESFLNLSRSSYLFSKIIILFTLSAIQSLLFVLIGNSIVGIAGMWWEYWYALFTIFCFANVLGLNISASFNSAVTIYILIPLFIIPQMILGGAMFSYDKLNENIGGGNQVPIIADVMASRWVFEALIVNQFVNNKYQKKLYTIDKRRSDVNYKMMYYVPKLMELSDQLISEREVGNTPKVIENLEILKNELLPEYTLYKMEEEFTFLNDLDLLQLNLDNIYSIHDGIEELNAIYIYQFTQVQKEKEELLKPIMSDASKMLKFDNLRKKYTNDYLSDIVTGSTKKIKITIENKKLLRLVDPIYHISEPTGMLDYRSHFYAPQKHFMGSYFSTFYFNLMVIWFMSILLFITLYVDFFRKCIQLFIRSK
jgi:ABC transport system ATP-binding/permease protein